tara:strand:- start:6361 stop:6645 length:285 start_codon:yes stop_codon:yes gene_type:complete
MWSTMDSAPMSNETTVELFTTSHGICEAWFANGEWSDDTPNGPSEYSGDMWVCCDNAFQIEVEINGLGYGAHFHGAATHWREYSPPSNLKDQVK